MSLRNKILAAPLLAPSEFLPTLRLWVQQRQKGFGMGLLGCKLITLFPDESGYSLLIFAMAAISGLTKLTCSRTLRSQRSGYRLNVIEELISTSTLIFKRKRQIVLVSRYRNKKFSNKKLNSLNTLSSI